MEKNVIKELIVNVHNLPEPVAAGVFGELQKSIEIKYDTLSEATVKWSINNLVTRILTEIAMKNDDSKHDLKTVAEKVLGFLESVLLPYTTENERELLQKVIDFIGCMKKVLEMDAQNKPMQDLQTLVMDFVNA